jgi:hypothetical protein
VEDAEPVSSAYVQVADSPGIGDRVRGWTQRRCLVQGLTPLPDRGRCGLDAERVELSVYPPIAPAGVLPNQAQNDGTDGADRGRAPTSLRPADTGMTTTHQIAVPA